jgi:hypothetical protein
VTQIGFSNVTKKQGAKFFEKQFIVPEIREREVEKKAVMIFLIFLI